MSSATGPQENPETGMTDDGVPLSAETCRSIAAALAAELVTAPYQFRGRPVYEVRLALPADATGVRLVLWPELCRADVYVGDNPIVFKRIEKVAIYPGLEVIFWRHRPRAFLLVAQNGKVATAS